MAVIYSFSLDLSVLKRYKETQIDSTPTHGKTAKLKKTIVFY